MGTGLEACATPESLEACRHIPAAVGYRDDPAWAIPNMAMPLMKNAVTHQATR